MSDSESIPADVIEFLGGEVAAVEVNQDDIAVGMTLHGIRDQLMSAALEDGVGINQLARRLDVAPSSVSRFFSSDTDIRVSTAVLYGRALGRVWDCNLKKDDGCRTYGNYQNATATFSVMGVATFNNSGTMSGAMSGGISYIVTSDRSLTSKIGTKTEVIE